MRTTYTTHHGGGWSTTRSKTVTLVGKPKTSKTKSRSDSGGSGGYVSDGDISWWDAIKALVTYGLLWLGMWVGGVILVIIVLLLMGH